MYAPTAIEPEATAVTVSVVPETDPVNDAPYANKYGNVSGKGFPLFGRN